MKQVDLNVIRVSQPIGDFYIGSVDSRVLTRISTTEVREFKDHTASDIAGIQRELSMSRVRKISDYVNFDYATFPTSIVIAVDERNASLMEKDNCSGIYKLTIHDYDGGDFEESIPLESSAFIIDGQHRLAGLENLHMDKSFDVNVSIFIGADLADKAEIFSTVNLAQTKVNRSLVFDLFHYAKEPSPFKMAHEITIALDQDKQGPLSGKIKRLGVATPGRGKTETLSQATVVRGLLRHLPKDPDKERNKGFLGLSKQPEPGENWNKSIFSHYYREGDDVSIFKIVSNYFTAVADRWPNAWFDDSDTFMLSKTNGYDALIRFLRDAYLEHAKEPCVVEIDEFSRSFKRVEIEGRNFTTDVFPPGSSGSGRLYRSLLAGHLV